MADNVQTYTGRLVATDQNSVSPNEDYQIVKLAFGPRDTNTFQVVQGTVGLPVEDAPLRRLMELVLLELRILNEMTARVAGVGPLEVPENTKGI